MSGENALLSAENAFKYMNPTLVNYVIEGKQRASQLIADHGPW